MGHQIIKQPDGLLAIFSSFSDRIIMWDATEDDVMTHFAERAEERARRDIADAEKAAREAVAAVLAGEPRKVYYQFATSWEQAMESDREHGGEYSERAATG